MLNSRNDNEPRTVTFDGEQFFRVKTHDQILIERSDIVAKLIITQNRDNFLKRVSDKLM
jgi:NAD kinase